MYISLKNSTVDSGFKKTRSVSRSSSIPVEYLIVGGGAGSGGTTGTELWGAGGGAGGLLQGTIDIPIGTSTTISVGSGGGPGGNNVNSFNGGASVAFDLVAYGGGGTSGSNGGNGNIGGSGGGGSGSSSGPAGAGISGQGNAGGAGNSTSGSASGGGGGGGAGGAGQAGGSSSGGSGGSGISSSITGSSVTYAAGGPGGKYTQSQTANTGNGAYAGNNNGASGVVILAYPNIYPALSIGAGLTSDSPSRSGYRVYRFTAGTGTVTF